MPQNRLLAELIRQDMQNTELAKRAHVAPSQVTRYCTGTVLPSVEVAHRIARVLGRPTQFLWPEE